MEIVTLKNKAIVIRKIIGFTHPTRKDFVIRIASENDDKGLEVVYTNLEEALSDYNRLKSAIKVHYAERDNAVITKE